MCIKILRKKWLSKYQHPHKRVFVPPGQYQAYEVNNPEGHKGLEWLVISYNGYLLGKAKYRFLADSQASQPTVVFED